MAMNTRRFILLMRKDSQDHLHHIQGDCIRERATRDSDLTSSKREHDKLKNENRNNGQLDSRIPSKFKSSPQTDLSLAAQQCHRQLSPQCRGRHRPYHLTPNKISLPSPPVFGPSPSHSPVPPHLMCAPSRRHRCNKMLKRREEIVEGLVQ